MMKQKTIRIIAITIIAAMVMTSVVGAVIFLQFSILRGWKACPVTAKGLETAKYVEIKRREIWNGEDRI